MVLKIIWKNKQMRTVKENWEAGDGVGGGRNERSLI